MPQFYNFLFLNRIYFYSPEREQSVRADGLHKLQIDVSPSLHASEARPQAGNAFSISVPWAYTTPNSRRIEFSQCLFEK